MTLLEKDQDVFRYLMQAAQEESEIKESIINILSLSSDRRKVLLDVLLRHSRLQNAPQELRRIFTLFLDDLFAQEVLMFLRSAP